jgi:hypothetical protein
LIEDFENEITRYAYKCLTTQPSPSDNFAGLDVELGRQRPFHSVSMNYVLSVSKMKSMHDVSVPVLNVSQKSLSTQGEAIFLDLTSQRLTLKRYML